MKLMRWKILMVVGLCYLSPLFVRAAGDKAAAIDALLTRYTDHHVFEGSVLVAHQGQVIYRKGHGYANREWRIANTPDTVFRIGSLSKSFTAIAIMQLVQDGKLRLDDSIHDYLPQFPADYAKRVTIRQLLTHRSGIPNYVRLPGWFEGRYKQPISDEAFLQTITELPLEFEPGSRTRYSNSGYFILGKVVEAASGESYPSFLQKRIFTPAGMTQTRHDTRAEIIPNRAGGYQWTGGGGYRNEDYLNTEVFLATGSLVSSVDDLLKWDQALYSDKLLNQANRAILFSAESPLSWQVQKHKLADGAKTVTTVGYNGAVMGFSSMFTRFPEDRYLVVLLSNSGTSYATLAQLTEEIAEILYDVAQPKPLSASFVLTKAFVESDLGKGISLVRESPQKYDTNEAQLNGLGYQFLEFRLIDQALEVFELVVALYPKSANAYDSLGEAFLIGGNREKAIVNYQKSLALNPQNHHAESVLKQLAKAP